MQIKEVHVFRKFPLEEKYKMLTVGYVVAYDPAEENRLSIIDKLNKELEAYYQGYMAKQKTVAPSKVEIEKPTVTVGPPMDNTQRIREVLELLPQEFQDRTEVYIVEDQVCLKFKHYVSLKEWNILNDFVKDVLKGKWVKDEVNKKESHWLLP